MREHGARRACDHARAPAGGRDPETPARDAATARDLHRRRPRLDAPRLRTADGGNRGARTGALRRQRAGELGSARAGAPLGRDRLRGARSGPCLADPLRGGRLGGRQPRRPADGVPLGLVRLDRRLPGVPPGDLRRPAARRTSSTSSRRRTSVASRSSTTLERSPSSSAGASPGSSSRRGASAGSRASGECRRAESRPS